jgi:NADH-quinone oxidoreductase subunit G
MSEITIEINGKQCKAQEGEYILNIARREDIFIPAICYLTGCSPTLACRICLVEADGKRVYSCNAKAKDGMVVVTDNEEISAERKAIMQVYDVNHPLQCGVCDQSGECELQNYTLLMNIGEQEYAIEDTYRPVRDWGLIKYDAGLCIVCEKCVTVCKDMIGDSVLKTVKRGGAALDKGLKETMPKDSYAMWNKLQKSIIGTVSGDETLECQTCGECIAVCPVGALVSTDFQYKANAWELRKIPASNPHSSDCSLMYYEVKHGDAKNYAEKIFRVTNDAHYVSLHGGARFGFDYENRVVGKDKAKFEKAVEFIKNEADTIKFTSFITNEEALILQKLKEKYSLKLINEDALAYKNFINEYSKTSGKTLYSSSIKDIKDSNFVVSVGSAVRYDAPNIGFAMNNAMKINKGSGIYFHPMGESVVESFSKTMMHVENKPGSEESVIAFVLDYFSKLDFEGKVDLPDSAKEAAESFIAEDINLPEDFEAAMTKMLAKKDKFVLVVGEDLYKHPRAMNIARLLGFVDKFTNFTVMIVPSQTNTLGVSLICELDEVAGEKVLAYNTAGDFVLSALGDGDLDMPALNQQEGTFTNCDKRVVPTNAALPYSGHVLNDIANALGLEKKLTIDYTTELPSAKGYEPLEFDLMPNFFDNGGNELRGYLLNSRGKKASEKVEKVEKVEELAGDVIYKSNPVNQFNAFTNKASQLKQEGALYVSTDYLSEKSLEEGDQVEVSANGESVVVKIELDKQLKGQIAYLPTFDTSLNVDPLFSNGYRFTSVTVKKV